MPKNVIEGIKSKYKSDFGDEIPYQMSSLFNGGFSLRKTQDFIEVISNNKKKIVELLQHGWFEDTIFSIIFSNDNQYKLPKNNDASYFSIETFPVQHFIEMNRILPMGCHAWFRGDKKEYDNKFWFKIIS